MVKLRMRGAVATIPEGEVRSESALVCFSLENCKPIIPIYPASMDHHIALKAVQRYAAVIPEPAELRVLAQ